MILGINLNFFTFIIYCKIHCGVQFCIGKIYYIVKKFVIFVSDNTKFISVLYFSRTRVSDNTQKTRFFSVVILYSSKIINTDWANITLNNSYIFMSINDVKIWSSVKFVYGNTKCLTNLQCISEIKENENNKVYYVVQQYRLSFFQFSHYIRKFKSS